MTSVRCGTSLAIVGVSALLSACSIAPGSYLEFRSLSDAQTDADQAGADEEEGHGALPVCVAKTQSSFSTDPTARGAPVNHVVHVREARLAAGAGFVVMICGDVMTMPGLPRTPAACKIDVDQAGNIVGLF